MREMCMFQSRGRPGHGITYDEENEIHVGMFKRRIKPAGRPTHELMARVSRNLGLLRSIHLDLKKGLGRKPRRSQHKIKTQASNLKAILSWFETKAIIPPVGADPRNLLRFFGVKEPTTAKGKKKLAQITGNVEEKALDLTSSVFLPQLLRVHAPDAGRHGGCHASSAG